MNERATYPYVQIRGQEKVRCFDTVEQALAYAARICTKNPNTVCAVREQPKEAIAFTGIFVLVPELAHNGEERLEGEAIRMTTPIDEAFTNTMHSSLSPADAPGLNWCNATLSKDNGQPARFSIHEILDEKMTAYGWPIGGTDSHDEAKALAAELSGNEYGTVVIDHEAGTVDWVVQVTKIGEPCTWEVPE